MKKAPLKASPTVIIADPPWPYRVYSAKGGKKSPKYNTMSINELHTLAPTVKLLSGKDSYMMMWATRPTLPDALALLATWGYTYKTCLAWTKPNVGTGYHARDNCELVLIGTRGQPGVGIGPRALAAFAAPRAQRHSSKPIELHRRADAQFPAFTKIELFARNQTPGWLCIGSDLGTTITDTGISGAVQAVQDYVSSQLALAPRRARRPQKERGVAAGHGETVSPPNARGRAISEGRSQGT